MASVLTAATADHFCAYVGSSWRSWSPSWRQHGATLPKRHPKIPILEATWFKTVPKTPQQAIPTTKYRTPQDSKIYPKRCTIIRLYTSNIFVKVAPKTPPMCQNAFKIDPKSAENRPRRPPTEHQVAILAPTWSNLGASCTNLALL